VVIDAEEARNGLAELFGTSVQVARLGPNVEYTVCRDDDCGEFTFAQMMALPSIVVSEHIDFRTESGHSTGSSWTGEYGHYNNLIITVKP
jgi:hypothetical protein